jgi:hypothetical protein
MSQPWVLRLMLGTLLVVMVSFLFVREPAIDAMPHRKLGKLTFWGNFWEAITAHSHRPAYPAEIAVSSERKRTSVWHASYPRGLPALPVRSFHNSTEIKQEHTG